MTQLAIKGHATRGKEIIEILEMLGGVNHYDMTDADGDLLYTIRSHDKIIIAVYPTDTFVVFSLEEFLEKFPYKVGDKVIVSETQKIVTVEGMSWINGREVIYDTCYNNDCVAFYSSEELQPCKEKAMEELKMDIPNGYEFAVVDDDKQQIVFTKIQPKYPKTYEECCKVLGIDIQFCMKYLPHGTLSYKDALIYNLQALLICRDAYWKIAGKQMGLGKPWKYDMSKNEFVYAIAYQYGYIQKCEVRYKNHILVFPTAEARDAFYENFKYLIKECKELL